MMDSTNSISILLKSLPGLPLPQTVSLSLPSTCTTTDLLNHVASFLPPSLSSRLTVQTTSNRIIHPSPEPISTLAQTPLSSPKHGILLPLSLNCPLPGGKGGFGSQLRAAGGRMSSRKRKHALASDPNGGIGSNRNLDGRRLRTVTEAKNLAEYLATKPEMERREKEEKRKRWEGIVDAAERREEEARRGGRGKGLGEEWLAEREDAGERAREAVAKAMKDGSGWKDSIAGSEDRSGAGGRGVSNTASASGSGASREQSEEDSEDDEDMELEEEEVQALKREAADGDVDAKWVLRHQLKRPSAPAKKSDEVEMRFVGFDEDEEFMSSSADEDEKSESGKEKGKQKMSA